MFCLSGSLFLFYLFWCDRRSRFLLSLNGCLGFLLGNSGSFGLSHFVEIDFSYCLELVALVHHFLGLGNGHLRSFHLFGFLLLGLLDKQLLSLALDSLV